MKILARKKWGEGGQFDPTPWRPAEWGSFTLYGSGQRPDNRSCMYILTMIKCGGGGVKLALLPEQVQCLEIFHHMDQDIALIIYQAWQFWPWLNVGWGVRLTLLPVEVQCQEIFHHMNQDSVLMREGWSFWPYPLTYCRVRKFSIIRIMTAPW